MKFRRRRLCGEPTLLHLGPKELDQRSPRPSFPPRRLDRLRRGESERRQFVRDGAFDRRTEVERLEIMLLPSLRRLSTARPKSFPALRPPDAEQSHSDDEAPEREAEDEP